MKKALIIIYSVCAILCIVYFGVIVGYSGLHASFSYVWIFFALIFASMAFFLANGNRHRDDMPHFVPIFIYTTFGLGMIGFILIMALVINAARGSAERKVDYCIVMGARVFPNGISKTLMYRLDEACEIYEENPNAVLVLAGGQAQGDAIPEAFAMYNYLSMRGVPSQAMQMEPRATSTYGIIQRAVDVIQADTEIKKTPKGPGEKVWSRDYEPVVGIITSDYHLFRSMELAKGQGLEKTVAIPAQSDDVLFVHNCVRESAEIIVDFFMGNVTVDESRMPEIPLNRRKAY